MNWFTIRIHSPQDTGLLDLRYIGSSQLTLEQLHERIEKGEYLRLDNLIFEKQHNVYEEWSALGWRELPVVIINPAYIVAVRQFENDPRL